jgi:hypothetical protein
LKKQQRGKKMPKNDQYQTRKPRDEEKRKVHPVWRGIGCISIVVIPILSYVAATQLIINREQIPWVMIPAELVVKTNKDPLFFVKILYGPYDVKD